MVMVECKSEALLANKNIGIIKSLHGDITPKDSSKFVGNQLQRNSKIRNSVDSLITKIHQGGGRIWQFPNLPKSEM